MERLHQETMRAISEIRDSEKDAKEALEKANKLKEIEEGIRRRNEAAAFDAEEAADVLNTEQEEEEEEEEEAAPRMTDEQAAKEREAAKRLEQETEKEMEAQRLRVPLGIKEMREEKKEHEKSMEARRIETNKMLEEQKKERIRRMKEEEQKKAQETKEYEFGVEPTEEEREEMRRRAIPRYEENFRQAEKLLLDMYEEEFEMEKEEEKKLQDAINMRSGNLPEDVKEMLREQVREKMRARKTHMREEVEELNKKQYQHYRDAVRVHMDLKIKDAISQFGEDSEEVERVKEEKGGLMRELYMNEDRDLEDKLRDIDQIGKEVVRYSPGKLLEFVNDMIRPFRAPTIPLHNDTDPALNDENRKNANTFLNTTAYAVNALIRPIQDLRDLSFALIEGALQEDVSDEVEYVVDTYERIRERVETFRISLREKLLSLLNASPATQDEGQIEQMIHQVDESAQVALSEVDRRIEREDRTTFNNMLEERVLPGRVRNQIYTNAQLGAPPPTQLRPPPQPELIPPRPKASPPSPLSQVPRTPTIPINQITDPRAPTQRRDVYAPPHPQPVDPSDRISQAPIANAVKQKPPPPPLNNPPQPEQLYPSLWPQVPLQFPPIPETPLRKDSPPRRTAVPAGGGTSINNRPPDLPFPRPPPQKAPGPKLPPAPTGPTFKFPNPNFMNPVSAPQRPAPPPAPAPVQPLSSEVLNENENRVLGTLSKLFFPKQKAQPPPLPPSTASVPPKLAPLSDITRQMEITQIINKSKSGFDFSRYTPDQIQRSLNLLEEELADRKTQYAMGEIHQAINAINNRRQQRQQFNENNNSAPISAPEFSIQSPIRKQPAPPAPAPSPAPKKEPPPTRRVSKRISALEEIILKFSSDPGGIKFIKEAPPDVRAEWINTLREGAESMTLSDRTVSQSRSALDRIYNAEENMKNAEKKREDEERRKKRLEAHLKGKGKGGK